MAGDWRALEDGEIAIAHISDLHFGSKNDDVAWQQVKKWLTDEERWGASPTSKLALVLVTGDLVHHPEPEVYSKARKELDGLGAPYYVCSGNHDRHKFGNYVPLEFAWHPWVRRAVWSIQAALLIAGCLNAAYVGFFCGWLHSLVILLLVGACSGLLWLALGYSYKQFKTGYVGALFNQKFQDKILSFQEAKPFPLGSGDDSWSLGLLGLDSAVDVDFLARGNVASDQLASLNKATCQSAVLANHRKEFDLCIVLVHHHLLPIRLREPERASNPADLFNATCLVNAGTVLERLSGARVDVALHGHEHQHNWAVYSSLNESYGPVRVLAAGSATGNHSTEGCLKKEATLNVLIFRQDRSVRLRRMVWSGSSWQQEDDLLVLDGEEVRESRTRRKAMLQLDGNVDPNAIIRSEIIKTVIFTSARDIEVYWTLTDWKLQGTDFKWPVLNSTGAPNSQSAEVILQGEGVTTPIDDAMFLHGEQDHSWILTFKIPRELRGKRARVSMQYRWDGGALLTIDELEMFASARSPHGLDAKDSTGLGIPRNQKLEFSTIWANGQPVAALELNVTLPPEYCPEDEVNAVKLFVHDDFSGWDEATAKYRGEAQQLRNRLRFLADGRYSLRVPFPEVNRKYTLAWTPVSEKKAAERLQNAAFSAHVAAMLENASHVERLLHALGDAFKNTSLWGRAALAIYVKATDSCSLKLKGRIFLGRESPGLAQDSLPSTVNIASERNLLVQSWWGIPVSKRRPQDDNKARELGFCDQERRLTCIPLRASMFPTNPPPWAVMRIGERNEGSQQLQDNQTDDTFNRPLYYAIGRFLAETFKD